jgi:hypothetical protein
MNTTATRWLSGTALSATLAASLATGALLLPRAAQADEQTVKLIQLLIQKGILSPGQAKDLLKETAGGKPRAHAAAPVTGLVPESEEPSTSGQIRVTYVPQFIRKQIADEVRAQVMDQAQQEGWATPDALPEWTKRFRLYGDLRMRYEGDFFDNNNYNQFVNFNAINTGTPFDVNGYRTGGSQSNPPYLNTTENRDRFRLRARIGFEALIDDWVTANIRIGTGQDDGPVSPNQTLGTGNSALGAAGDFAKPALWLDRGYFKLTPLPNLEIYAGRMNNPFLPSDLMFYPELGFDGVAAKYQHTVLPGVTLFGTGGAFPLFNTAFDFSTNSSEKFASTDSYLAAAQAGVRWDINSQYRATLGVGIFDFLGVQGAVSKPCPIQQNSQFYCNTDSTRTPFVQFGNTLYDIRNIIAETGNPTTSPDPQYYGLASRFNVLDIHPRFDIMTWHPIDVAIEGEFIKNLAYNRSEILTHGPVNSTAVGPLGPVNNLGNNGAYQGGDTGYMVKVALGQLEIQKKWDWNAYVSYRYLETDATLDAIADADFHLGGTNARGYLTGVSLGIARNTWLQVRYMSSQVISGPPFGVSQVYVDLNSRF